MAITKELKDAIRLMKEGKEEGFAVVYAQTYNYVYGKAKYLMKLEEDALDLTQETYIQAYKGIDSLDDDDHIYAWLGGIVYRQGMKIFNKKKDVLTGEDQEYIFEDVVSEEATPEESVEQDATKQIVKGMIEQLPELQKVAVMAFYYDNMKIDEIAEMCECSSNTIKSRLNYAKKFLKDKVEEHEKKNRYKLCSLTPAILFFAFKDLLGESAYRMPANSVQAVYATTCGKIGLQASSVIGTSTAGMGGTVAASTASAATKTGIGVLSGKVLAITVAVVIGAGAGTGILIHNITNKNSQPTETISEDKTQNQEEQKQAEDVPEENVEPQEEQPQYNENIPLEGKYAFGGYTISITNANVTDDKNATYDLEMYTERAESEDGSITREGIQIIGATETDGVTSFDTTSDAGNRWFGDLTFIEDGSIIASITASDPEFGAYDCFVTLPIFTKAVASDAFVERPFVEGTYQYIDGSEEYTVTISELSDDGLGQSFKMSFELVKNEGDKIESLIPDADFVFSTGGVATFSGSTGWDAQMQGYMYMNEDGSLTLGYHCVNYENVYWGGFGPGRWQPLTLTKLD